MKKMTVFLAAGVGAAMLTGCGPGVMGDRYYKKSEGSVGVVPAARMIENEPAGQNVVAPAPDAMPKEEVKAPVQKPAYRVYEPMQQVESDKVIGIDSSAKASGKAAANGKNRIYKVRRGDTPSGIAVRHKVSLAALMQANNLTESDAKKLRVGQQLVIPAAGAKKAVVSKKSAAVKKAKSVKKAKKSAAASTAKAALESDGTYIVKRGDSPERIARKFKVKLADLLNANSLDEKSSRGLQIGQKLIIPGSGVTQSEAPAPKTTPEVQQDNVIPAADNSDAPAVSDAPAIPAAPAVSGDDLAKKLENAAPSADNAAAESDTGSVISHVIIEKEISLADFAAQQKTTVEELKRINSRPLPEVLRQNEIINIPFGK